MGIKKMIFELFEQDYDCVTILHYDHKDKTEIDFRKDCEIIFNRYMDLDSKTKNGDYFYLSDSIFFNYLHKQLNTMGYKLVTIPRFEHECNIGSFDKKSNKDDTWKEATLSRMRKIYSYETIQKFIEKTK